jgi:hypothetical protein
MKSPIVFIIRGSIFCGNELEIDLCRDRRRKKVDEVAVAISFMW